MFVVSSGVGADEMRNRDDESTTRSRGAISAAETPLTHGFTIRRATLRDAPVLSDIAHAAKHYWGYPDSWLHAWAEQLTISAGDVAEGRVYAAVDRADRAVACYALFVGEECVELNHFWVHPSCMGRGIGRAMFSHAIGVVRELGCRELLINSDPNAAGFYERMGAERVGAVPADVCGVKRVLPRLRYVISHDDSGLES